jgi:alpha/beta superfamily hydrolase
MTSEHPVFVPHGDEHIGAVVTLPDGEPRGLVLLLTGTGAPRSHRFQMWTRTARALAEVGLATVRMDYLGLGDSTGEIEQIPLDGAGREEALNVLRFAQRAVGVRYVGVAGNCSGSQVALEIAAEVPECVGAACLLTRILEPSGVNRVVIGARRLRVAAIVRSHRFLSRLAEPLRGRRGRFASQVERALVSALSHARLLFVYTREDTDSYDEKGMAKLEDVVRGLAHERRERFQLRVVDGGPMAGFESLEIQDTALSTIVEWMDASFPALAGEPAGEPAVPARG